MSSVAGSASSRSSAARVDETADGGGEVPPADAEAVRDADAGPDSRLIMCCAPVPEAATRPTGPGRTTLAKPSPTPPMTAVPQSGPITSRPRAAAACLSRTSCSTGTLSEKTITDAPASSASIASTKACRPGVETSTRAPSPVGPDG